MAGPLVPFRQFVLKVHSRCDLACRHCYVYEHADQSWSSRPKVIAEETVAAAAARITEHVRTHALPSVHVILHGGEPLLAGPARLRRVCEELSSRLAGICDLDLRIHTNGVQLSERYLDLFDEFGVKVGVSLDGDKAANDRHRVFANGLSSHRRVLDAVSLLRRDRYRHLYAGLLCTIDVANDPEAVYAALAALEPPRIDFLLPHATWDEPPARPDGRPTAYADWLLRVYDAWDGDGRPMPVRLFDSVISTLGGGPSLTESLGLGPTDLVVIETDGSLEQADSLKTAYDGAPATGLDVRTDSLDTAASHPGVLARQRGLAGLSAQCRSCPVVRSCGGGLYAHRHRSGTGFDNPSVFCTDLKAFVEGMAHRTGLPATPGVTASAVLPAVPDLDALAAGPDAAAVARLAAAQRTVTHGLLRLAGERLRGRDPAWDRAWALVDGLQEPPGGLDTLLGHPYSRSWAVTCLDALDAAGSPQALLPQALRLSALAAAAALRTGAAGRLTVPVAADGVLVLPGVGAVRFAPGADGPAQVVGGLEAFLLRRGDDELKVVDGTSHDPRWQPLRTLALPLPAGSRRPGGSAVLDDLDPCRDCHPRPAAARLTAAEAEVWQRDLARAWNTLAGAVPAAAAEMAEHLTVLTPLTADPVPRLGVLPGGRRGLGAVGMTVRSRPPGPGAAADLLAAWQHTKLDALLELHDLYDEGAPHSFPAPWGGPRMAAGDLLAHAYARTATAPLAEDRQGHAAATAHALDALLATGVLTALGTRFVQTLRHGVRAEG